MKRKEITRVMIQMMLKVHQLEPLRFHINRMNSESLKGKENIYTVLNEILFTVSCSILKLLIEAMLRHWLAIQTRNKGLAIIFSSVRSSLTFLLYRFFHEVFFIFNLKLAQEKVKIIFFA